MTRRNGVGSARYLPGLRFTRAGRLRSAAHAACVLAGLLAAVAMLAALALPHPAATVDALASAVCAAGMAGSVLAPKRTRPVMAEGSQP